MLIFRLMAIYHFTVKLISRSKGQSAVASAAYRRADKLFDARLETTHDYRNKPDVIHSELTIPANAPAWLKDLKELHEHQPNVAAEKLWNLVETHEHRKDAQVAREVQFALPLELTEEQNIQLTREFVQDQFALLGMVADWNVHWDEGNPHVHVMLTTRTLTEEGLGQKERTWNAKPLMETWREQWAAYVNYHLRLHQHDVRVDHRSYEEQGIDLIPTVHQGKAVRDMDKRGIETEVMKEANAIRQENLRRIAENPDVLVAKVASQQDVFTPEKLIDAMGCYIDDKGGYRAASVQMSENSYADKTPAALHAAALLNENSEQPPFVLTPEIIADVLARIEQHDSVFDERKLAKAFLPYTRHADDFARALLQLQHVKEIIPLGLGDDGRARFTTKKLFQLENRIGRLAGRLAKQKHTVISPKQAQAALARYEKRCEKQLTDEQRRAVLHLIEKSSIRCLVGRAGTGKSFLLGAAREVWEAQGLKVRGIALSGIAADGLSKEAGIESRTIGSFLQTLKWNPLTAQHVVVMDEAGMADSTSMYHVIKAVTEAGSKLVLVGDPDQLQPIGPGAVFRSLIERLGFSEIKTIYRQRETWQREATQHFAAGRADIALSAYEAQGYLHLLKDEEKALQQLVADWSKASQNTTLSQLLVIAHRNQDVDVLNRQLRESRIARGEIAEGYEVINTQQQRLKLAIGDRLLFTKNDKNLGVKNGRFGTLQHVDMTESGKVIQLTVLLDNGQPIQFRPKDYAHIAYGYAATVHKVQGVTVEQSFVYFAGKMWDRHLSYVAGSRHKDQCHYYASQTEYADLAALKKQAKRLNVKDSVLDYPLAFAQRRGIEPSSQTVLEHLKKRMQHLVSTVKDQVTETFRPATYWAQKEKAAQVQQTLFDREQQRQDASIVAHYVDLNRKLGQQWEKVTQLMQAEGITHRWDKRFTSVVEESDAYQACQHFRLERNEAAYTLTQAIGKYTHALQLYGIQHAKLFQQAEKHQAHLNEKNKAKDWRTYWKESQPLANTLVEKYFKNAADIDNIDMASVRFHPQVWEKETQAYKPAIIAKAVGYNAQGKLDTLGAQFTFLDETTAQKAAISYPVQYHGEKDTIIMLQKPAQQDNRWFMVTNIEDGATIAKVNPTIRVACFAHENSAETNPLKGQGNDLIFCSHQKQLAAGIDKTAKLLSEKDFHVYLAQPEKANTFAELHKKQDINSISQLLEKPKLVASAITFDKEVEVVKKRFAELDKELNRANQQSYLGFQVLAREASEKYSLEIAKNNPLMKKLEKAAPDLAKRIHETKDQEKVVSR